ncbi:hypothetical protein INT48_005786 [Thamnidium elegans]|uniref:Uncharacterized protein n=1 Tax=Thamnidium elegans TaxID=101142 RepID=A0A8H7SUT6_9FUNG|nr:hypothetical protein INT48_005786 [Thamnidium elegans]
MVPRYTYDALYEQYGPYWTHNSSKYSSVDDAVDEQEQIKSIVLPLGQVLLQVDSIIPLEFQVSSTTIEFLAASTTHANNDAKSFINCQSTTYERERRRYKDSKKNISEDNTNITISQILTRNKKRSLLNKYTKELKKYEEKNQAESANKMRRIIDHMNKQKTKRSPKSLEKPQMKKDEEDNDIEKVNVNKEERYLIPAQLPLLVLSNQVFETSEYTKFSVKLCPRPSPSSCLCLPLDTTMLYMLMTNFNDSPFDLFSKEGKLISSLPSIIKDKAAVFGPIFDIKSINEYCNSRGLTIIHRILIRPGSVTCVINGSTPNTMPKLEKTAEELNKQLQDRKKSFNLEEADRHIRNLNKERNSSSHEGQRNVMAAEIKIMKQRRWTDFKHIEILRRELKETRRKAYFFRITTLADNVQNVSRNHEVSDDFIDNLLTNINDLKFSGTDYGLQTMSVTAGISENIQCSFKFIQ